MSIKNGRSLRMLALFAAVLLLAFSAVGPLRAENAKPTVLVLATGGTIAGVANQNSSIGYDPGQLKVEQLLESVPGLEKLANIKCEQIANISSQNMNEEVWLKLAGRINRAFKTGEAQGVVITHGTDTMEETAFFLEQVLEVPHPVVLVGSMRPSTALSADGPQNLYDAVHICTSPDADGRGVMLAMNGTIFESRDVMKNDSAHVNAFVAAHSGPVGIVDNDKVDFFVAPPRFKGPRFVIPANTKVFPRVDIIYAYAGMGSRAAAFSLQDGARGIVTAGVGNGNTSDATLEVLKKAAQKGVIVVRSCRIDRGYTHRNGELNDDELNFVASLDLSPQKARILLQLLLLTGKTTPAEIQKELGNN